MKAAALAVGAAIFYGASICLLADLEPVYSAYIKISDPSVLGTSTDSSSDTDFTSSDDTSSSSTTTTTTSDPRNVIYRVGVPSYTRLSLQASDHKDHIYYRDIFRIESHCDHYDSVKESESCVQSARVLATKLPYYKKSSKPESGRHRRKFFLNTSQLWSAFLKIVAMAGLIVLAICEISLQAEPIRQISLYTLGLLTLQLLTYLMTIFVTNPKLSSYLDLLYKNLEDFYQDEKQQLIITSPTADSFKNLSFIGLFFHLIVMISIGLYLFMSRTTVKDELAGGGGDVVVGGEGGGGSKRNSLTVARSLSSERSLGGGVRSTATPRRASGGSIPSGADQSAEGLPAERVISIDDN